MPIHLLVLENNVGILIKIRYPNSLVPLHIIFLCEYVLIVTNLHNDLDHWIGYFNL